MANEILGFMQVDGTAPDFSESNLQHGYVYFIRTNAKKTEGYMWLNGKRYGAMPKTIDCGTFHGPQEPEH